MEPKHYGHVQLFVGFSNCGKTHEMLNIIEEDYMDYFQKIVLICPTFDINDSYNRSWIKKKMIVVKPQ